MSSGKVAIYIRVAREEQTEDYTIRQYDKCLDFIGRSYGNPEIECYQDIGSRLQLESLLTNAEQYDTVVVSSFDRLARGLDELLTVNKTLHDKGVKVLDVTGTEFMINFMEQIRNIEEEQTTHRKRSMRGQQLKQERDEKEAKEAGITVEAKRKIDRLQTAYIENVIDKEYYLKRLEELKQQ
ncbi:hypothetical protein JCM17380_24710 [Desulfosporosinus burensis]